MSQDIIIIGVMSQDSHDKGWGEDITPSRGFGSIKELEDFIQKIKNKGIDSPEELENALVSESKDNPGGPGRQEPID